MSHSHPQYTPTSVEAQRRLPELNSPQFAFAGAYHGWGFHEDGARSGHRRGTGTGCEMVKPITLYRTEIRHQRSHPAPSLQLSQLLVAGGCGSSRRHSADSPIGDQISVARLLRRCERVDRRQHPRLSRRLWRRSQRYVDSDAHHPKTILDTSSTDHRLSRRRAARGGLTTAVAGRSAINTYGDRHRYLLRPGIRDNATARKQMPVAVLRHGR